jgi:phosphoribosylanthranilate isomerase
MAWSRGCGKCGSGVVKIWGMRTRVKICGVRSVEDGLLAARAGADAVGVICVPGAKRYIGRELVAEIAGALPAFVTPVAVFADAPIAEVGRVVKGSGIRTVQLHGHEPVAVAMELHKELGVSVIKRLEVGLTLGAELDHWSMLQRSVLAGIVVEGPGRGGTGVETDWDALAWTLAEGRGGSGVDWSELPPVILAGGLTPENVGIAIRRFRPHGVDTSSGVESPAEPLKKDLWRLQAFMEHVRAADDTWADVGKGDRR